MMGQTKSRIDRVSFGKSRLTQAALPFNQGLNRACTTRCEATRSLQWEGERVGATHRALVRTGRPGQRARRTAAHAARWRCRPDSAARRVACPPRAHAPPSAHASHFSIPSCASVASASAEFISRSRRVSNMLAYISGANVYYHGIRGMWNRTCRCSAASALSASVTADACVCTVGHEADGCTEVLYIWLCWTSMWVPPSVERASPQQVTPKP